MALRHRPRSGGRASLPEAELELLALLERLGESDAATLRRTLTPQRALSHPSVVTLLRRLEARGLVQRRPAPKGRAYLYSARGASGIAAHLRRLATRLFADDRVHLVSALFEDEPPTQEELADLAELVAELRARSSAQQGTRR